MKPMGIFTSEEFGDLEVINIKERLYFDGIKACKCLGYSNSNDAIRRHCKYPGIVFHEIGVVTGKKRDKSDAIQYIDRVFIDEGNLYRLIIKSKKEEAQRFECFIMDIVLPSIRKYGAYSIDEDVMEIWADVFNVQRSIIRAQKNNIKELDDYRAKNEQYIKLGKNIEKSDDVISIGAFAKIISNFGIRYGRNQVFSWLREHGYIMKQNGENQPKQRYIDMGLFKTRELAINTTSGPKIRITTYITGKGQIYFTNKLVEEAYMII